MPDRPPEIERLRPRLTAMLGAPVSIGPLPSGSTGPSYLIESGWGRCVAKVFDQDSGALLGPAEQFELLGVLADADLAPRPIGFDRRERLLVTEFLEGTTPLSAESLRKPAGIEGVARCLRRLHAVPVAVPRFAPVACAERYIAKAGGLQKVSERDRQRHAELCRLAAELERHPAALCHNDLLADNLLYGDDGVRLIDFDYAVTAPPLVDLASVAVMNELSEREASTLLAAYYGEPAPPLPMAFTRVQRLVRLVAHFWAQVSRDAGAAIVARYRIEDG